LLLKYQKQQYDGLKVNAFTKCRFFGRRRKLTTGQASTFFKAIISDNFIGEIITGNYDKKLSQEIMRRNYHASIYHHAKNVGIIGILPYPKIKSKRKRRNRRVPLPFRGKRAENCSHNVGKSLGEGLG
jgi:hypothetical protein